MADTTFQARDTTLLASSSERKAGFASTRYFGLIIFVLSIANIVINIVLNVAAICGCLFCEPDLNDSSLYILQVQVAGTLNPTYDYALETNYTASLYLNTACFTPNEAIEDAPIPCQNSRPGARYYLSTKINHTSDELTAAQIICYKTTHLADPNVSVPAERGFNCVIDLEASDWPRYTISLLGPFTLLTLAAVCDSLDLIFRFRYIKKILLKHLHAPLFSILHTSLLGLSTVLYLVAAIILTTTAASARNWMNSQHSADVHNAKTGSLFFSLSWLMFAFATIRVAMEAFSGKPTGKSGYRRR